MVKAKIIILLLFSGLILQAQDDIDELIRQKSKEQQQQSILKTFKGNFPTEDRISIKEFRDYYEIVVSHPSTDGFTGGAEGYKLSKSTGEYEMTWHEHPMPLPIIEKNMKTKLSSDRDSIITIGFQMIKEIIDSNMSIQSFDKILVFRNSSSTIVSFTNPVKYIPFNSSYYYDISVDIVSGLISYGALSNPKTYVSQDDKIYFYKPDLEADKNTQFVIDVINKNEGTKIIETRQNFAGNIDGSLIIYEEQNYFAIERISEYQESFYKINKQTGEVYDEEHNELSIPPIDDVDPLIEIR